MDEETRVPRRLAAAVVIVFITMSLGICSLFVFIYNLPRIFPPPKGTSLSANLPTLTPESNLTDTSQTPLAAPSADFTLTASPTPLTTVPTTSTAPVPTATMPAPETAVPTMPVATSTPAATPTLSPDGGHLVFTAEKSGSSIYIMAATEAACGCSSHTMAIIGTWRQRYHPADDGWRFLPTAAAETHTKSI